MLKSLLQTLALFTIVLISGACEQVTKIYVDRSGCLSCHRPLQEDGTAHGIEEAHPPVEGYEFTCESCHGGNPGSRKMSAAHVNPGAGAQPFIKNLTIGELDQVSDEYIRFVNPGDLRVAQQSCGSGAGNGCHQKLIEVQVTNQMATFSGELGVARYRAGQQNKGAGNKGVYDVIDESFVFGEVPGTVGSLQKMEAPLVPAGETEIGPYQDIYLTKACMRCHLWSFGDNKFPGDFRSSGCTACHMVYGDDGLSLSDDPMLDHDIPPHPQKHVLTSAIPNEQCVHCHYRGGRIGISYQGYREGAGPGLDGDAVEYLEKALHGHDANFYITDENLENDYDETPPDVHHEAGMHCVDCHTSHDVHGDGHLYTDTVAAIEIRCDDCHGTVDEETDMTTRLGNRLKQLERDEDGKVWLTKKLDGEKLEVKQIKQSVENASLSSYMHRSMGRDENGFSHMDNIACHTCHSAWMPNCYGCHVEVDMSDVQRSLIDGYSTPGRIKGSRKWVATDDLILMLDTLDRISPSMPSEKMFFTALDGNGDVVIDNQVRTGPNGEIGHGHRAFSPHTIRRWSPFMRCDRCHLIEGTHENADLVNITIGLGSDRYIETDGDGNEYRLDQIIDENYDPLVLVGHDEPAVSQPLTKEIIERMLSVEVPGLDCPVPGDVAVPFEVIQDSIFSASCALSECHDSTSKKAALDLSAGNAYLALINAPSTQQLESFLVVPGDPDASYLVTKLLDTQMRDGQLMPIDAPPLEDCQVEMIRGWIRAGAQE